MEEHTKRNTAVELRARQTYIEQQEKNRQVRVSKFRQKPQQYHAGDLFHIETHILDLTEHARNLIPNLVPLVGQPILNSADFELRVDSSKFYLEDQLAPLIGMIWKVVRFVDDRVHLQQAAGTTKVGYNLFYDHKLAKIHGLHNFSGTKADREFWSLETKDILKIKAHEKLLGAASRAPPLKENNSTAQNGSRDEMSSKTKRNRHQRQMYQKRQKAKKAAEKQQQNQQKAATAAASTTTTVVKKDP